MSIAKQAAHGVAWNLALGMTTRLVTLVGQLVLTRFMWPEDYGAAITASIVVATAGALTSFSFGQYLIARQAPPHVATQAAAVQLALGIAASVVVYLVRGPVGSWLDAPAMGRYLLGFAVANLIIDRVRYVPERILMRSLRFRTLATINGIGELAFMTAAIASAPAWGAYAVMVGALTRSLVTSVLFLRAAPRSEWLVRARLRASDLRDLFLYGLPIMVAITTDNATRKWDNLIVARLFGPGVMAGYNYAYNLADTPISYVAEHINEVLMPSFSRMEPGQRERAAVRAASLMSMVISPLGVGLGAVAPAVASAFFDERWGPTIGPMLAILSLMTVFGPMHWSAIAYAQAVHRTHVVMWSSFVRAALVLALLALGGLAAGPNGACMGAGLGYALHSVFTITAVGRASDLPSWAYLRGIAQPLLPCVPMVLAVVGVGQGLAVAGVPVGVSLVAQIAMGAIVYIAAAFLLARRNVDELLALTREAFLRHR